MDIGGQCFNAGRGEDSRSCMLVVVLILFGWCVYVIFRHTCALLGRNVVYSTHVRSAYALCKKYTHSHTHTYC